MKHRVLEVAAAATFGILLGVVVYAIWVNNDRPTDDRTLTVGTVSIRGPLEPSRLIEAFERSRLAVFALDGELTRERDGEVDTVLVRQARRGDRGLDEVGAIAIVIQGDTFRRCELVAGQVLCTDAEPSRTVPQELADFELQVGELDSLYGVYFADLEAIEPQLAVTIPIEGVDCWALIASEVGSRGQFGDEATLCFDRATGTLVFRSIQTGSTVETFRALLLRTEVQPNDLEPSGA